MKKRMFGIQFSFSITTNVQHFERERQLQLFFFFSYYIHVTVFSESVIRKVMCLGVPRAVYIVTASVMYTVVYI